MEMQEKYPSSPSLSSSDDDEEEEEEEDDDDDDDTDDDVVVTKIPSSFQICSISGSITASSNRQGNVNPIKKRATRQDNTNCECFSSDNVSCSEL